MPRLNYRKLSAAFVKSAPQGVHGDGGGLALRVAGDSRAWIFRYSFGGKPAVMGLGPTRLVTLAEARDKAIDLARTVRDDIDPAAAQRDKRNAERAVRDLPTFAEVAEQFIAGPMVTEASKGKWRNSLATYIFPSLGSDRCQDITTDRVYQTVRPIWDDKKEETGRRVAQRVAAILDFARTRGWFKGDNPAAWTGNLAIMLPARVKLIEHHAAVPHAEMPATMAAIRAQGTIKAAALEFAILTAARTGEALKADWSDIDLENRVWREVPIAQRNRSKLRYETPLSDRVVAILEALPGERVGKVFGKISGAALREALEAAGRSETPHGMRATFKTWLGDKTSIPRDVAEMCLGHTIRDKVEAAYVRSTMIEKRREALEAWARYCDGGDNIRQLRTA